MSYFASRFLAVLLGLLVLAALSTCAGAQCAIQGLPSSVLPGVNGLVYSSTAWDPDGSGPEPEAVVIGGHFSIAGNQAANAIAAYSVERGWRAFGDGFPGGLVSCMVGRPNGGIVAGGIMWLPAGNGVSHWNGVQWEPLGNGLNGQVLALANLPNGDLVAGGYFTASGNVEVNHIARYDFVTQNWSAVGVGFPGPVGAIEVLTNGHIIAKVSDGSLRLWNGFSWSLLISAVPGGIGPMKALPNGDLLVAGGFTTIGGVNASHLARWNGTSWSAYAPSPIAGVGHGVALAVMPNGDLVLSASSSNNPLLRRWNGSSWSPLGAGVNGSPIVLTAMQNGDLVALGSFTAAGDIPAMGVARWNGAAWSTLGTGFDGMVRATTIMPNGDLVVAGEFTTGPGGPARSITRWDGATWSPFANGLNGSACCVHGMPNGDVMVGGSFNMAGNHLTGGLARWNGSGWLPVGVGSQTQALALAGLPNGDIIASLSNGPFTSQTLVSRWNGVAWTGLGFFDRWVLAIAVMPNNDLVVAGTFNEVNGMQAEGIARWNGSIWSPLGSGIGGYEVSALLVRPNGDLIAGGDFYSAGGTLANNIARWDGASWSAFGWGINGGVRALTSLPNGDFVAGGVFQNAGGIVANNLARWNGSSWSSFGPSTGWVGLPVGIAVNAMSLLADDSLAVGGWFTTVGASVSPYYARFATDCPAGAMSFGAGCNSSAGAVTLKVDKRPWIGGSFRATTTGLPAGSLAVGIGGLQSTSIPLPSILPQSLPGCDALVSLDALYLLVPSGGVASSEIPIPPASLYIGKQFYYQVVALELDMSMTIVAAASSNGLELIVGSY